MKSLISTFCLLLFVGILFAQSDAAPKKQMSLVTKHTATWCPFCGLEAWDTQKYFMDNLDGENAIVMAAHISGSSKLYSQTAKELLATYQGVIYQPEFFFNTTKVSGSNIETQITEKVQQATMQVPLAQTDVQVAYNPETDMLKVKTMTEFFEATDGQYQLSILVLEREVFAEQSQQGSNVLHRNIIRRALTETTFGPVLASGSIAAGTQASHEVAIKWNNQYDLDNIKIVTILWKRNNIRYDFVNASATQDIETESTTTSNLNVDVLAGRFSILPNATNQIARIQLDLPQNYTSAEITLFDQFGRQVQTLHRGSLQAGEQTLQLDRHNTAAGIYFVRFRSGKTVATRRVVFF